ncbi:type II toxin-antitoxin system RelE/ParE family toxin [Rhodoplanes sp. Z2-YC6860]|uniref:type II toxin-antitoxin system RelE/ParE family toxin n=1 Tax=Rhodoplanes sp. Z2-YC6860 TaxID=674703 RepID=UPI00078B708D|nr:toxin, ParE-ParD toxin-antitoxin system [Rhodoplanes sp. Z2-YC6860]
MASANGRLFWSPDAEEDLISAWLYGASEWSPIVADEHLHLLWRTARRLLDHSELGKARDELAPGVRSLPADPHMIFYRIENANIQIVRVLHQREDIDGIFH